jgi:hypothetical protein
MTAERLVLVRGMAHTRETLDRWNQDPWRVLRAWLAWSLLVAVALLGAVYLVARASTPDSTPLAIPGLTTPTSGMAVLRVLYHNSLVLALHAMACVAGFIAGASLPELAEQRTGFSRIVHEKAGPLAIAFVVCATGFSLCTQAYILGHALSTLAAQGGVSPAVLLVGLLPHALPELTALFLPLAAWVIASRRGQWNELLAATFVTVALAVPTLILSALIEIYVSPRLILALTNG